VKDLQPDLAAVIWDEGLPLRRTELQPAYKGTRSEMPDEMKPQLTFIQKIVPLLGFASLGLRDTEADDLMASYTCAARGLGHEVVLATNDKDLFQLVDEKVKVYTTNKTDFATPKDTFALLGEEAVRRKWGVTPEQIGEVLSLIGDSVDNIPGVDGLGAKGAANLLATHGSLDAILANPEAVKNERMREKLRAAREQIVQNREMVRLDKDLPLPKPLDELALRPRYEELIAELGCCEFKSLMDEIKAEATAVNTGAVSEPAASAAPAPVRQGELF
jgi:DNA polymerase-1